MGQFDLQHDEVVIRRTTSVMVRSVPIEITLTTRRLVLVDSRTDPPAQKNIPLASIREIKRDEDTTGVPVITLSVMTESGNLRQMIVSFPPLEKTVRTSECKEWFLSLEERTALTRATPYISTVTPSKSPPGTKPGTLPVEEPKSPPKARDWVPDFTPYLPNTRPDPVAEPPKKSGFIKIGAVILVILVIIFIIVAAGQFSKGKTATPQTSPTLATVTTAATPLFTPTAVPTQILPTTAVSPSPTATPKYLIQNTNGIWMRIQYPGRYTGYVGSGGLNTEVNATGEWLHQLPIDSGMIEGTIEKQDGSTDDLIVEVYKDGALISSQDTRTPRGVLYIRTSV